MRNFLVEIAYNGARYHGYQVQKNALTITEVLQNAIEATLHKREPIVGCSRTDAGVHANSYFFNMKTELPIPMDKFVLVMNGKLPPDIVVLSCKEVPLDFHARYDCRGKEYIYRIYNCPVKDPFQSDFAMHYQRPIDEKKLDRLSQTLVGTHDFSAFCTIGRAKEGSMVRTVEYIHWYREGDVVSMKIRADGFLYNMVRIIVGTMIYINEGRIGEDRLPLILESKDRKLAGKTAPPQGLYLNHIDY